MSTDVRREGDDDVSQLTDEEKARRKFMRDNIEWLSGLAHDTLYGKWIPRDQFVMVCIQVDSPWRPIVDELMPGMDWQKFRDRGEEPIARGSVFSTLCERLSRIIPEIAGVLMKVPPEGKVKAIALHSTGITVYEIEPKFRGTLQ